MTEVTGRPVDLRISTLPIIHGEKTCIRVLDKTAVQFALANLGFGERATKYFTEALDKPNGIILVTGPTGSGKSTTLYTGLNRILNAPDTNIHHPGRPGRKFKFHGSIRIQGEYQKSD